MATITITRTVHFHGDSIAKGVELEAQPTEGGWLVDHPRVEGASRKIPATHAAEIVTTVGYQHRNGLVVIR